MRAGSRFFWIVCGLFAFAVCVGCHTPSADNGAVLFKKNCVVCHSLQAGQVKYAPSLHSYFNRDPKPTIRQTRKLIQNGRRFMPAFRKRLSSGEIDDLIAFLKTR
jgi:mono/diheme cytochrome c family protein